VASRLWTVGRGVFDGNGVADGRGVSVEVLVGGMETVCVAVGAGGVNVSVGEEAVLVGDLVSAGFEVGVELQANDASINRIGKISFRLMS